MRISELLQMDVSELKTLRENVRQALEIKSSQSVNELGVGALVNVDHPKTPGVWTINKINRKTIICEQDGRRIKCSMNMLSAA